MADEGFTTIWNPVNGLPWECPDAALDYWTNEKGFTKKPNKNTPTNEKEAGNG